MPCPPATSAMWSTVRPNRSATNDACVSASTTQQPSTAAPGLCLTTFSRAASGEVSAFTAATHAMNTGQAVSDWTGPRDITWLAASPF